VFRAPSHLLVRVARADDRCDATGLLMAAGWTPDQLDAWNRGLPALVLYDPADGTIHGAVVASRRDVGVYDLIAWAVADSVDPAAAASRLVRALADRVRRTGGDRLVVSVRDESAVSILRASGFEPVADDRNHGKHVSTHYLEL
jgi:hypothetical protein